MTTEKNFRILIIDDNPAIHNDFIKILKFQEEDDSSFAEKTIFGNLLKKTKQNLLPQFEIDTALQGQIGVQLIEEAIKKGTPYALAFVDIRMPPGWDGIETIKHIWKYDPDIQIVICTAYSDYSWEETIGALGEKENLLILKKPFDIVSVRQLAFALTKKWQLLQEKHTYTKLLEKRVEERTASLEHLATHDVLTELPNRMLLIERLNQLISQANQQAFLFAIIFFDLDRFKLINDSLGHTAGDELLKLVSSRIQKLKRSTDTIARFGGDEFIVVAPYLNNEEEAKHIVKHLLKAFNESFEIAGHQFSIGASAGISLYPRDGRNVKDLLRNADAAMYRAKSLGSNQFQFYTDELNNQNLSRLEMENDLHQALLNNEFVLYYQPQFNVDTKEIVSFEALLRWNHPKKGLLLPIDFVHLAEEIGLIIPISDWVLREACQQNKKWQQAGLLKTAIAVNIESKQVNQPDFAEKIKKILKETGLEPHYLELELTENVIIDIPEYAIQSLSELKALGVHIALDDFGAGHSSMNYLRKIPLNRLKIDKSFVENININTSDEIIIQSIIFMAKQLNLDVLAEGVETKKQLEFLKTQQCKDAQGYYLSQALSSKELENLLLKK